jgi:methylmalonyl-CoA mutase
MHKAWHHIQEVESLGGMAKAIETGIPKMRIEEAAARRRRASIPAARSSSASTSTSTGHVEENLDARSRQWRGARFAVARLAQIRARATGRGRAALDALTAAPNGRRQPAGTGVIAARARATLGEISTALEKVFGRYQA